MDASNRVVRFLRHNLVDYNVENRNGQFIFPDFPRELKTSVNNYPMIGITLLDESGLPMGIGDPDTWDTVTLQIDIFTRDKHNLQVRESGETLIVDKTTYPLLRTVTFTIRGSNYL